MDLALYEAYFFDLDGTIYTGSTLLPGVNSIVSYLKKQNKRVMYLTNTSIYTRQDIQRRLQTMGLEPSIEDIITAAYIGAMYVHEFHPDAKVFVVGEEALEQELDGFDIARTSDPLQATHLLVGMDRHFTYGKMHMGMKAVRNGAQFIVTNPDPYCPVPNDNIPDTWAIAKAIEAASTVTIDLMTGKPSLYYIEKVLQHLGVKANQCLMIGDRLDTDIMLGVNSGVKTALVLTGVTSMSDVKNLSIIPDYILSTLGDLFPQDKQV